MDPINENATPAPENNINMAIDGKLRSAAISGLLKAYVKFLFKKGLVDNKDVAKERIGAICSPALDRGIITNAIIDDVCAWIESDITILQTAKAEKCEKKFICKVLGCEVPKLLDESIAAEDREQFAKIAAMKREVEALCDQLNAKYGAAVTKHAEAFFGEFKNLFDQSFAEYFQK